MKINYLSFYRNIFSIACQRWFCNKSYPFSYLIIPILIPFYSYGQQINSGTVGEIKIRCRDTIINIEETIIPGTIEWESGESKIELPYQLINNSIILTCTGDALESDTIILKYKYLPYPFHKKISLWDSSQIKVVEGDIFYNPVEQKNRTEIIESPGLTYDGALSRGFSLGNNQSLVFDSELNLQLGGNIGDGYEIKAAITDNNLPIQPDGTTRQIREFDKVYIEVKKDQHSILAGDFDAVNPEGYFMRYNRKLKGAQYSYSGIKINQPWHVQGSAGISRGKFTRQNIIPTEGNQGPYPLQGENGELFIIVLAGSEKVYIDGKLLVRGEDADYIMDYNQSEITFTKNILINVRHRITVEFEYAQFNFQKSHNAFEARYQKENIVSFIHFFQENDSKSVTGDLELSPEDLVLLNLAGDQGDQFFKSGIRESSDGYNSNAILYMQKDTVVEGVVYEDVLAWSTNPDNAILIANFTEVGFGNGDYIISPDPSPNGRVYAWVAPDPITGLRKGNFLPLIPLQAPQQRQMISAGGKIPITKTGNISGEISMSRQDLNRYSPIDDEDNTGLAMKVTFTKSFELGKSWKLIPFGGYERAGTQFRPLDPYRNPEFNRDWNLIDNIRRNEQIPTAGIRIAKSEKVFAEYRYDGLFRSNFYDGNMHHGHVHFDTANWTIDMRMGVLSAADLVNKSQFLRPTFLIERTLLKQSNVRAGVRYFEDKNEVRDRTIDTLRAISFIQNKMSLYVKNDPLADVFFLASFNQERPKLPVNNGFQLSEKVSEWNFNGHFHQWQNIKMEYTIKHRSVDPLIINPENKSSNLLGRIDLRADIFKKAFKLSTGYEIGNGQEPKTEYKFIKVQKGEGLYTWVDDGDEIEELNEFELAPFADQGEYIRLSVFNNDFILTRSLGIQQSVNADLKNLKATGIISKIALLSTYQLSRKIREDEESPYWNPFYRQYADTSVLGYSSTLRNILYWNRASTVYDVQFGHVRQENQLLQTSGYDNRLSQDITLRWRVSLQKKMDIVINGRTGTKENRSQFFESRNYKIQQSEIGPELNVILKDKFRLTGSYQFLYQQNLSGSETFHSNKLSFETVWRKSSTTDIRGQVSLINIDYVSAGNMNVDFTILQGLQNGTNLLWNLQFNTRLNKSLILTLQYNGRDTGEVRTIHTGSAQIRAAF